MDPNDTANHMTGSGGDLARRALECFALEEFKNDRITAPELLRLLGLGSRYALEGFLKAHGVYEDYTMEDFERDHDTWKRLGF